MMIEPPGIEYAGAMHSWVSMMQRCLAATHSAYHHYGGRGIRVCERWRDFRNFLADMGPRPDGYSIDRIDVNGHYEPENCRWVVQATQARNKRSNVWIGDKLQADVARELGVESYVIHRRLKRGETGEDLFRAKGARGQKLWARDVAEIRELKRQGSATRDLAKRFGVSRQMIQEIVSGKAWT